MVADKAAIGNGLYMTEEQYLALDEATDGNYEFYDGYVVMLSPPSSAYDEHAIADMAGGSTAHSAICARLTSLIDQALPDGPVRERMQPQGESQNPRQPDEHQNQQYARGQSKYGTNN